jgi:methyl-accepting chemotaxis protein
MFKSIKWKIFSGFLVLTAMLFVAGSITIFEFVTLSRTVNALLDNNYNTMQAASTMMESLEREDSGILLLLSGDKNTAREMMDAGDSSFQIAYKEAQVHSFSDSDMILIKSILPHYQKYRSLLDWNNIDTLSGNKMNWYSTTIYPVFVNVKSSIKSVMVHNQEQIYHETTRLKDKSKRAIMPGIVAILSAILLTLIFTYFINKFFVKPIMVLTNKVENYKISNGPIDADIITQDELKRLEAAIQDLVYRLKRK